MSDRSILQFGQSLFTFEYFSSACVCVFNFQYIRVVITSGATYGFFTLYVFIVVYNTSIKLLIQINVAFPNKLQIRGRFYEG